MDLWGEITGTFSAVAEVIWPGRCLVCGKVIDSPYRNFGIRRWVCGECLEDMPLTRFWQWTPNPAEENLWKRVGVVWAASLYFYRRESGWCTLVRDVKYNGNVRLGRALGYMLGNYIRKNPAYSGPGAVVPVPLHPIRRWRRGYNQAEAAAKGLAEALHIPLDTSLLRRVRYTRTQTRLDAKGKEANVRNAFAVNLREAERLRGKGVAHIIVVDDVMTTGSTITEAVKPLMPLFAVSVATLGFVE